MKTQTAVVLGSSGLTGSFLVPMLLNDDAFDKVRILVRKPSDIVHPKLEMEIVDFNNLPQYRSKLGKGDTIFCCIGTTLKNVKGDKKLYREIDMNIPVHAAQMGKDAGFTGYFLVSAVGADAHSANFYLKLKGEVEKEIAALQYERFHVFRPSLVMGNRKEFRLMELMAKKMMSLISPLFIGPIQKYRGMLANDIAAAMVVAAKNPRHGMFIHHYADMMKAAQK